MPTTSDHRESGRPEPAGETWITVTVRRAVGNGACRTPAAAAVPSANASAGFEYLAQLAEVLAVGTPHCGGHERGHQPGEPGRFPAVAQGHLGGSLVEGLPRVRGLHRERPFGGAHD